MIRYQLHIFLLSALKLENFCLPHRRPLKVTLFSFQGVIVGRSVYQRGKL